jgi:hypothetical protein
VKQVGIQLDTHFFVVFGAVPATVASENACLEKRECNGQPIDSYRYLKVLLVRDSFLILDACFKGR